MATTNINVAGPTTFTKAEEKAQVVTPAQDPVAEPALVVKEPVTPKAPVIDVQAELAQARAALAPDTLSYLKTIEDAAKRLSLGPEGVLMDVSEIQLTQGRIFSAILYLITTTADAQFSSAMYCLTAVFKDNRTSRVGGLSPERIFAAIGYSEPLKAARWLPGKSEADLAWFRSIVMGLHMAGERGGKAVALTTTEDLVALTAIKNSGKSQRFLNWITSCNALKY